jgi:hypothetical protein
MKAITGREMDNPTQLAKPNPSKRFTQKLPPTYPALKKYLIRNILTN